MNMEYRPIEVKLMCAKDLKDVNMFSKMDVYVVGSVSGDPRSIQRTGVDKDGGVNPRWNYEMKFNVDESAARLNRLGLVFQIMSDRTLGDREIGRVYVPFKDLFESAGAGAGEVSGRGKHVTYQVQTSTGKFKGQLEFSFRFGERYTQSFDRRLNELLPYGGSLPMLAGPEPEKPEPEPAFGPGFYPSPFGHGSPLPEYPGQGNGYGYGYGYGGYPPNPHMGYGFGCPGQAPNGFGFPGQGYGLQPVRSGPADREG